MAQIGEIMNDFSLLQIWQLKGKLDNLVYTHKYEHLIEVEQEYQNILKNLKSCQQAAFAGYNYAFWTEAQKLEHLANNKACILNNIKAYINKYV